MWYPDGLKQIIATIYSKVRIRDVMFKSTDTGILQVRNVNDSAYAGLDVGSLALSGTNQLMPFPCYYALWANTATVVTGAALTVAASTSQAHNLSVTQTAALGNKIKWPVRLNAGTYTFNHLGVRNNASGQVQFLIEDSNGSTVASIGTLEMYAAGSTFNVLQTLTLIQPSAGSYFLSATVIGQNPSSAGFQFLNTLVELIQTA